MLERFIYTVINLILIAAVAFLFGRKMITAIFRTRRERLNRELDEADSEWEPPALLPTEEFTDNDGAAVELALRELAEQSAADIKKLDDIHALEALELKREMMHDARNTVTAKIAEQTGELLSEEPYVSRMRERENEIADRIIEAVKLTPGDIAYLKTHDVLYVTLTSAFELDRKLVNRIGEKASQMLDEVHGKPSYWVKVDPTLIGGLRFRVGDTIYDGTIQNALRRMTEKLNRNMLPPETTPETMLAEISEDISQHVNDISIFQQGRVLSLSDGICWLDGLADIMFGEVVEFDCGERGMVLDIESDRIGCVIFGRYDHIESGSKVRHMGVMASVPVGNELIGRIVDPLGVPIDGKGRIWTLERRPIENPSPPIPDRRTISVPLHTGIKAIDALVPIGRGQRELIIGDRQTGKTSVAIDTIINQKGKNVICVYVAIGQKEASVAETAEKLRKYGAMAYTVIVCATASESASLQYIAPFSGTAIAEYFMYSGRDVLIVYDDLSKHAVAYRELSLLLHRPSGREAYPGDIFYLHSRLLERSARMSETAGGGSITALPIIETQAGDISAYIPTNVISITDGQIFLETELFNEGQRPAVNVGLSVSRVGSAAQTKLMKQISSRLRMNLAQYRELATFAQFGSDLDDATRSVLASGERMMAALRQRRYSPLSDSRQCLLLCSVAWGYADGIDPVNMESFEEELYRYFESVHRDTITRLDTGKKLSPDDIEELKKQLTEFIASAQMQTGTA